MAAREAELATSADAVVTLSQTMVDELSDRGVANDRIMIVPNGVEGALLEESLNPREARALLGIGMEDASPSVQSAPSSTTKASTHCFGPQR